MKRALSLLLGILFTVILVELALTGAQWAFMHWQQSTNLTQVTEGTRPYRILCIGESTTAVAGSDDGALLIPQNSYPSQLEGILEQRRPGVDFEIINNGLMGGTSQQVLALLESSIDAYEPDMIIAMMGIKDDDADVLIGDWRWPAWVRSLKLVQLARWVRESVILHRGAVLTEVEHLDELPKTLHVPNGHMAKYIRESRMVAGAPEMAALKDLRVAVYLWFIGRHVRAETKVREIIATHDVGHNLLARILITHDRADEAVAHLREAVATHPTEGMYAVTLVESLTAAGGWVEAHTVVMKNQGLVDTWHDQALAHPRLLLAWSELAQRQGRPNLALRRLAQAKQSYVRSSDRNRLGLFIPFNWQMMVAMGEIAYALEDWKTAEHALKAALEMQPWRQATMWQLGLVYRAQGKLEKEAKIRSEMLARSGRLAEYFELAKLFRLQGQEDQIPSLVATAHARIPQISQSYAHLSAITRSHGTPLVVMQYPSFSLDLLHIYMPADPDILFIDNEDLFAADPDRYFFEPRFPHSFSHYTKEGAALMAERVADEILPTIDAALAD